LIEVNLHPGGKRRATRGPKLSFKLPSVEAFPKDTWVLGSSVVVVAAVAALGYLYFTTNSSLERLSVGIDQAVSDSARYADLIEQNDALMARRDSVAQRVAIIQEIDGDRYVWPHLFDEIARALPEYTWLSEIFQVTSVEDIQIRIVGRAGNNFALTTFMENLEASFFIRNVELVSTEQVIENIGGASKVVYSFSLDASFERPPSDLLETESLLGAPEPVGGTSPSGQ